MTTGFGARLRSHRERRQIGLDAIAQSTKIGVAVLEALERDDTSRLPSGIYRRGFIRAYATAVGLDPESTLAEFLERFGDPNDEWRSGSGELGRADTPPVSLRVPVGPLRLTLADESRLRYPRPLGRAWPRVAAAACDFVMVIALGSALFALVGMFRTCFSVATVCYYFSGVLLVGTSPATYVIGRRQRTSGQDDAAGELLRSAAAEADPVATFSARTYPRAV